MIEQDAKLLNSIQKTLAEDPYANQRTLAQESHISLGMMNAVLKRCMDRGWIAVNVNAAEKFPEVYHRQLHSTETATYSSLLYTHANKMVYNLSR